MTSSDQPSNEFRLPIRVYYEDTDAGGVVYYANYLHFIERARTEIVRSLGFEQAALARDEGIAFAVRSLEAEYLRPARLDDELIVASVVESMSPARVTFKQRIDRDNETLFTAKVLCACFDVRRLKAAAMSQPLRDGFQALIARGYAASGNPTGSVPDTPH